ncbi:hypothetical protein Pmar_PMAR015547 [Perkinsus marinus ATCC 50983]|uniref:SMP-30/Gluconolactonase/LRE-like region domain-containing protein n=1 Tax=Perkinsus marinus (strain ATCC 50983 / TXsc) TaxID=423536 RepID=C5KUF3_PERM5|nr:hypothetical protein Pmar_PMAR015547 [Perkinsus marinus ATCC 50983]EER11840.1 hypothetical protein Pmar_PMAR015547 [Perkinsus marinus ATCC 50983]|eukprot:XP_002780045.1 hypothetical protein Pmar_PMAR015547 [Perkinsus marinus ATCC 50983]
MKSDSQVASLELRLIEHLWGCNSKTSGPIAELEACIRDYIPPGGYSLDCPRERVTLTKQPEFLLSRKGALLGVHATWDDIILWPVDHQGEVIVLEPGCDARGSLYVYDSDGDRLLVLYDNNTRLMMHYVGEKSRAPSVVAVKGIPSTVSNGSIAFGDGCLYCTFTQRNVLEVYCVRVEGSGGSAVARMVWSHTVAANTSCPPNVKCRATEPGVIDVVFRARVDGFRLAKLHFSTEDDSPMLLRSITSTLPELDGRLQNLDPQYVGLIGDNWIGALGERLSTSPNSAGGKSHWFMVVGKNGHFVGCAMKGAGSIDIKQIVTGVNDTVFISVETKPTSLSAWKSDWTPSGSAGAVSCDLHALRVYRRDVER